MQEIALSVPLECLKCDLDAYSTIERYVIHIASKLLKVGAALHNMCIKREVHIPDDFYEDDEDDHQPQIENQNVPNQGRGGLNARNDVVENYFSI